MAEEAGTPAPARRRWRTVDGIVLLDKPEGLSSNQTLQRVRRALQAGKAGHAGTLDPMATGMLPLCFGQATKACGALLGRRKAYRATVRLGAATDTGDREGRVSRVAAVPSFDGGDLRRVATSLQGERLQVPPMYSALKRDGRPLYELARRGETVNRAARPIAIESLQLDRVDDTTLALAVTCSKGTYVRVLAEEVAAGLGTVGHLVGLRRSWVEPFEGASMVTQAHPAQDPRLSRGASGKADRPSPQQGRPAAHDRGFSPESGRAPGQAAPARHRHVRVRSLLTNYPLPQLLPGHEALCFFSSPPRSGGEMLWGGRRGDAPLVLQSQPMERVPCQD